MSECLFKFQFYILLQITINMFKESIKDERQTLLDQAKRCTKDISTAKENIEQNTALLQQYAEELKSISKKVKVLEIIGGVYGVEAEPEPQEDEEVKLPADVEQETRGI